MLAALRRQRILDEMQVNGSALITRLAEKLSVSGMTIRRDLAGLATDGLLERVHGGAVLAQRGMEEQGFDKKVLFQQDEKAAIASLAATMVKPRRDGDGRSHVILTGGDFRTPSDALVGPTAHAIITDQGIDPEGRQLLASQVDDLRVANIRPGRSPAGSARTPLFLSGSAELNSRP